MNEEQVSMEGEYSERGDYHKNLDKDWSYYHPYVAKTKYIDSLMKKIPKESRILDCGCGEGILVKKYAEQGYDIKGIDLEYSSSLIQKGSVTALPFEDGEFDVVLFLDVIEHLYPADQQKAIEEIYRVLKKEGKAIFSIPNLAHLSSRLAFLFLGRFQRTAKILKHPGDRPIFEYKKELKKAGFRIQKVKGISQSIPILFQLTQLFPRYTGWLYFLIGLVPYPNWAFLNIITTEK